eukprot:3657844-Pleurochrysis_carterae.AAC.1
MVFTFVAIFKTQSPVQAARQAPQRFAPLRENWVSGGMLQVSSVANHPPRQRVGVVLTMPHDNIFFVRLVVHSLHSLPTLSGGGG